MGATRSQEPACADLQGPPSVAALASSHSVGFCVLHDNKLGALGAAWRRALSEETCSDFAPGDGAEMEGNAWNDVRRWNWRP
jgi:hypothetical protein